MVEQLLKCRYGKLLNQGQKSGTSPEYSSDFHRDVETFSVVTEYKLFLGICSRNSLYGKFRDTFLNCSKFSCFIAVVNKKKEFSAKIHASSHRRQASTAWDASSFAIHHEVGKRKGFQEFIVKFSTTHQHFDSL